MTVLHELLESLPEAKPRLLTVRKSWRLGSHKAFVSRGVDDWRLEYQSACVFSSNRQSSIVNLQSSTLKELPQNGSNQFPTPTFHSTPATRFKSPGGRGNGRCGPAWRSCLLELRPALVFLADVEHSVKQKHSDEPAKCRGDGEADGEIHDQRDNSRNAESPETPLLPLE